MESLYYQSLLNECSLVESKNTSNNDWEYIFSVYEKSSQLDILEKFEFSSETKKRRQLYIKMFTRYLGKHFPVIFEDNITNDNYNIIYFSK